MKRMFKSLKISVIFCECKETPNVIKSILSFIAMFLNAKKPRFKTSLQSKYINRYRYYKEMLKSALKQRNKVLEKMKKNIPKRMNKSSHETC